MERLTKRGFVYSSHYVASKLQYWSIAECLKKLQAYEDSEEDGLLRRLPCKPGTTVYHVAFGKMLEVENVDLFFLLLSVAEGRFGKTVFLTKAEAEKALAEMDAKSGKGFK